MREDCVREAFAIIGESGLEALSLRDVARRLKVSHQAPYKHFPSRDHILAEVVSRAFADFAAYLDRRKRSPDALRDFGYLGHAYLAYARAHPLHYRLMFGTPLPPPERHPDMLRQAHHAFTILRETIGRIDHGRSKAEVNRDALFAWSTVHGLASIVESRAAAQFGFGTPARSSGHTLKLIGAALAPRTGRR